MYIIILGGIHPPMPSVSLLIEEVIQPKELDEEVNEMRSWKKELVYQFIKKISFSTRKSQMQ